jgi:protein involved in polysaccharide export with SLBB domain
MKQKAIGMFASSLSCLIGVTAILVLVFIAPPVALAQVSSRSKTPEVRKAIPIAPRQNSANITGSSSESSLGAPMSRALDRATGGTEGQAGSEGGNLATPSLSVAPSTMKSLNDKRRIGVRDRLSFMIVEDERPAQSLMVTDSGEVDVPHIGRVTVESRTCKELAMHIKRLLEKELYYHATVLIGLDSAGGQQLSRGRYYIHGEVNRAGPHEIPLDEVLTISKAIIRAGGFTQYAKEKKVRIVRRSAPRPIEIDMVPILKKGDTRNDIEILPEDKIFVDEKFFNFF